MRDVSDTYRLSTRCIRGGLSPDPTTGAILTPIHQTTTYVQDGVGEDRGFCYSRTSNPTVSALEQSLGVLEDALPAACFATGMAAISALALAELKSGDHVVVSEVVYGGTVRLFRDVLSRFGVLVSFVDTSDVACFERALRPDTRLALVESPANPTLRLTDISACARIAHSRGLPLAVDNTFLTAALQRPLDLGADIVVYSTTKFIEGHNATVGGAVLTRDASFDERLRFVRNTVGSILAPHDAWLTLRGLKTLPVRMQRHCTSARRIAEWLERREEVLGVIHPGLDSFPQRDLARRQQQAGGGVIAFELSGGLESARRFAESTRLCSLAESLGAVETLITHPASMTHASIPVDQRESLGITDGLLRLSVGLEHPDDLIADLEGALGAVASVREEARDVRCAQVR